jgi:hypothetical protein
MAGLANGRTNGARRMRFVLVFTRPVASGAVIFGPIRFGFLGTHFTQLLLVFGPASYGIALIRGKSLTRSH